MSRNATRFQSQFGVSGLVLARWPLIERKGQYLIIEA